MIFNKHRKRFLIYTHTLFCTNKHGFLYLFHVFPMRQHVPHFAQLEFPRLMNTSLCTVTYINTDEPHYALSVFLNILSCTSLCIESVSYI